MPGAIAAALVEAGLSAATATIVGYAVTAVAIGANIAITADQRRRAEKRARQQYEDSLRDRIVNVRSTVAPRQLVLGRVRTGGAVLFVGSAGQYSEKLVLVIAIAAHQIDGVETVYFNDEPVPLDADGYAYGGSYVINDRRSDSLSIFIAKGNTQTFTLPHDPLNGAVSITANDGYGIDSINGRTVVVSRRALSDDESQPGVGANLQYQYDTVYEAGGGNSRARLRFHLGAPGQTADARLIELFPAQWTSAHRLDGIAYAVAELDYDETIYAAGVPNLSFVVRGDPNVYDFRTGTTGWTDNLALLSAHVVTHPLGANLPRSVVSAPHAVVAANDCDDVVSYTVDGITTTRKRYTGGYVHTSGTKPADSIGELVEGMAGFALFTGSGFVMRAGVYHAPVMSLGDDDLAGSITISPRPPRDQLVNVATGSFASADHDYKIVDLPRVPPDDSAGWIAADGGELPLQLELGAVGDPGQAQHVATVMLRRARSGATITATFKPRAYPLEVLDTVSLTLSRYGLSAQPFEVMSRRWTLDGGVELVLQQTGSAIYDMASGFSGAIGVTNTYFPSPLLTSRPTLTQIDSGTHQLALQADGTVLTRVLVAWALPDDAAAQAGRIEVAWWPADEPVTTQVWPSATGAANALGLHLLGPQDGRTYLIRARWLSSIAPGPWSVQTLHTVVGKTEPPSDVTALVADDDYITWARPPDADLAGTLLRWHAGTDTEWETATPLHTGLLTDSPYRWTVRPQGPITLLAKHQDRSGLDSRTAAVAYVTLQADVVRNIVEQFDYSPTFPGTIASGAVVAGQLVGQDVAAFWDTDTSRLFWGNVPEADFWPASEYAGLDYTTTWCTPTLTRSGDGIQLLATAAAASGLSVEYQSDAQPFWGQGSDLFWGADPAADFWGGLSGEWHTWPGSLSATAGAAYRWRVRSSRSSAQPVVSALVAYLDAPDLEEIVPVTALAVGGTRLPLTKAYRSIVAVVPGLFTGSSAVGAEALDYSVSLGPLMRAFDSSRSPIAASASFVIKGY